MRVSSEGRAARSWRLLVGELIFPKARGTASLAPIFAMGAPRSDARIVYDLNGPSREYTRSACRSSESYQKRNNTSLARLVAKRRPIRPQNSNNIPKKSQEFATRRLAEANIDILASPLGRRAPVCGHLYPRTVAKSVLGLWDRSP